MATNNTKFIIFALQTQGRLTEWLGSGLQNRLRRFESATDLNKIPGHVVPGIFCFSPKPACRTEEIKQKSPKLPEAAGILLNGPPKPDHENNPPPTSN